MSELLPCPFCKAGATYFIDNNYAEDSKHQIGCNGRDLQLHHECWVFASSFEEAVTAWNTRTPITRPDAEKALQELDALPFYLMKNDPRSGIKDPCDKATITRAQIDTIKAALTAPREGDDLTTLHDLIKIKIEACKMVKDYNEGENKDAAYMRGKLSAFWDALELIEEHMKRHAAKEGE